MSDAAFERALAHTVGIEGDYSNHPSDSGGKTRFGITEARARAHGYTGDMRDLPLPFAREIYAIDFWMQMRCDAIARLSEKVALELFDTGVNVGTATAVKFLQRALNALNRQQRDYADIKDDGVMGSMTLAALQAYFRVRTDEEATYVLLKAMNCLQGAFYIDLSQRREKDEDFVYGWLRTRVEV